MSENGVFLPPATFEFLVMELAVRAQVHLGLFPAPEGLTPDLQIAQHSIDLLAVLQDKTKGNLTLEEQRALENLLTDLRFRYVQAMESKPKSEPAS